MVWVLFACVGVLWDNQCERVIYIRAQTQQECNEKEKYINSKLRDGYAKCFQVKENDPILSGKIDKKD